MTEGRANGEEWWTGWLAALPADPSFFRRWFDDAARWGATCIEFDWLLVHWFGVEPIRAVPGRAAAWQRAVGRHADEADIDLLWCMATPADYVVAAEIDRMVAVRTCDDYRFAPDPAAVMDVVPDRQPLLECARPLAVQGLLLQQPERRG